MPANTGLVDPSPLPTDTAGYPGFGPALECSLRMQQFKASQCIEYRPSVTQSCQVALSGDPLGVAGVSDFTQLIKPQNRETGLGVAKLTIYILAHTSHTGCAVLAPPPITQRSATAAGTARRPDMQHQPAAHVHFCHTTLPACPPHHSTASHSTNPAASPGPPGHALGSTPKGVTANPAGQHTQACRSSRLAA
jgi:hypothetical protein